MAIVFGLIAARENFLHAEPAAPNITSMSPGTAGRRRRTPMDWRWSVPLSVALVAGCVTAEAPVFLCEGNAVASCGACPDRPLVCPGTQNCVGACDTLECPGTVDCGTGSCADVLSDDLHCGACGLDCGEGYACCNGRCRFTLADPNHCGGCDRPCVVNDVCCDGDCTDLTDDAHCGGCGLECPSFSSCTEPGVCE